MTAPQPQSQPQTESGGNFFSQKWGPLPVWAWLSVGAAALLIISYLRNKSNNAASAADTSAQTDSSQIPQFINQTYTNGTPPEPAPSTSVSNTLGGQTVTSTDPNAIAASTASLQHSLAAAQGGLRTEQQHLAAAQSALKHAKSAATKKHAQDTIAYWNKNIAHTNAGISAIKKQLEALGVKV